MLLLSPEILNDARELSPALTALGAVTGVLLWMCGARSHRFWVALAVTVGAGLHGLLYGGDYGMNPLVAGLLLAVTAGTLALSLVRMLVFAAGGVAALTIAHLAAPAVDEPLVSALIGGLISVVFYRLCITALTSLAGTLLLAYSGLCLADRFLKINAIELATRHGALLNWGIGGMAALGVVVQCTLERWRSRWAKKTAERAEEAAREEEERSSRRRSPSSKAAASWWPWPQKPRRAG
jgi:hypothetical protein